ncbi:MAG: ABC transporter ATP-binding protein [Verrucomicrobiales bacterium]|nr:ABC transporter ATP-binding protein [Verrucomicrobiales bacterium]
MRLELKNVSVTRGGTAVLEDVSLSLSGGKIVALVGANGVGKTTLLSALATVLQPSAGEIQVDAERLVPENLDLRRKLMFLPDFPDFHGCDMLTMIATHLKLWRVEGVGMVDAIMGDLLALGIAPVATMSLSNLSRGQRYKAALAALFAVNPELWLLDEPFASGMDPQGIAVFREKARAVARLQGRLVIYSTQLVEVACGFADEIIVLTDGRARSYDNEKDLGRDPQALERLLLNGRS